ncbi:MAG: Ribosomal protein S11 [Parcubacteria group bacterium GW2011_GWA2_50_10b]|nr:MAG: Ribosomal protein S11 [Parcubacteria group bacterium GW2011_GWA2_50_10b]
MGKKKIATVEEKAVAEGAEPALESAPQGAKSAKRRVDSGVLCVESTYNNTKLVLTDPAGGTLAWSSSGSLGFKGAKKGTPFAAAKVGETLAVKAQTLGVKEVRVVVKGVGSGRESAIRGFISKGINLTSIQDMTPVPHNGPKPPKPRRT